MSEQIATANDAGELRIPRGQGSAQYRRWRHIKDAAATRVVTLGGLSVIFAVVLIMFYLVWVVLPLFVPASVDFSHQVKLPATSSPTVHLATEEQAEIGFRLSANGEALFFNLADGAPVSSANIGSSASKAVSFTSVNPIVGTFAVGFEDGTALLAKHSYRITYPNDQRLITPFIEYPFGEEPVAVGAGQPLLKLAVAADSEQMMFAALVPGGEVLLTRYSVDENLFTGEREVEELSSARLSLNFNADYLLLDPLGQWLYVANKDGKVEFYQVDRTQPQLNQVVRFTDSENGLTSLRFLMGGISLLAGSANGELAQWFPVRNDENQFRLEKIRSFSLDDQPITSIAIEQRRKGMIAADPAGNVGVYYSTSHREVTRFSLSDAGLAQAQSIAVTPRSNKILALHEDQTLAVWDIDNEYPETSWSALWGKVWYEGYQEPDYIWQSSAANTDFEPKFSLTPLAFGTLKAAFYAMLLALPLAIAGATYTAYFMSPGLRRKVKPVIEVMEALPTVILGFLAGLWLAPIFESSLSAIFMLLLFLPISLLAFGFSWNHAPERIRQRVADGWEPILLVPVIIGTCMFAFWLDDPVEQTFFAGNLPQYISQTLGVDYDQRNSIVVGFAMGFAVIPTIFSITEDAVFGVPKPLINGSLALGATPWQTLVRVVLPTASPGMFSAVMIGMGRAVGETMIVLMATGNTAVMDWNLFEGMRTLSANIAVEMPESEVGSSHYRILFLAGLVLFMFTFVVNTIAEVVRQRLRAKYSSL